MPLSWCNSEINLGGICYFLITTVSLWSLELTCFDAGQGELQTPRQSKNLRYKEHHDERISRFSGTSVCRARGTQPDGQRAAPKARGDRRHPGRAVEVPEGREANQGRDGTVQRP